MRHLRSYPGRLVFALAGALAACGGGESLAPSNEPPARLEAVSNLSFSTAVGAPIAGGIVVRVSDAAGRPVQGVNVAFAVTLGNGSTNPRVAVTDSKGQATAAWTVGTIVGQNEVSASVNGVLTIIKFQAAGVAGPVSAISLSTQNARLLATVDTVRIKAQALDAFGNATSPAPVFTVRDPSLVTIDGAGLIRALRRGSATWVVANAGGKSDSVRVTVLALGQSICTGAAEPLELAVGQVVTGVSGTGVCVKSTTAGAEYALVPFYNSAVSSSSTQIEIRPQGITPLSLTSVASWNRSVSAAMQPAPLVPDHSLENRMRAQERAEGLKRFPGSGNLSARRSMTGTSVQAAQAAPVVGEILSINTNPFDFCENPDMRVGRIVAITDKAIVVADTNNPIGGFTAEEYRSIGVTFDTLVDPIDRRLFGDPSDIDKNGRVIMFFTRAVNELTAPKSGSVYLGYFYGRDLYPKTAAPGPCVGSNNGEIFYLMVPDTGGVVNTNKRTKPEVTSYTLGTVAHEYHHLINASRRMYVNNVGTSFEEKWLDEGLSHIAEEMNFWASSGRKARSNIDLKLFDEVPAGIAYTTFARFNTLRYQRYLGRPETQSPIGFDSQDDDLETRGAIWSFLRYAADRLPEGAENAFWYDLANSKTSGMTNLAAALKTSPAAWIRDWAISVFLDDNVAGLDSRYQQPSWNMRSIITAGGAGVAFPLITRLLTDNVASPLTLVGNGVSFQRFSVASGQEALLTVTSGGQPLPPTVQLAVVRVR